MQLNGEWIDYGFIETGQMEYDSVDLCREMQLERPIFATRVKITINAGMEREVIQGRLKIDCDILIPDQD